MNSSLIAAMRRAVREDEDGRVPCVRCGRLTYDRLGRCGLCAGRRIAENEDGKTTRLLGSGTSREANGS